MLSRSQRLSRQRIAYVFKKGRRISQNDFILKFLPTSKPVSRFCVIVSTKIHAKAVERNLVRRRIYEAIRLLRKSRKSIVSKQNSEKVGEQNYDVIMIPSIKILDKTYQDIERNISHIFQILYTQK